jgi:hypothetical protein
LAIFLRFQKGRMFALLKLLPSPPAADRLQRLKRYMKTSNRRSLEKKKYYQLLPRANPALAGRRKPTAGPLIVLNKILKY